MIPLRDSEAARRLTLATTTLIVVNVAVFAFEVQLGAGAGTKLEHFVMVPRLIARAHPAMREARALQTLITSQFLHAGLAHIAGNMLYLFIFGPAIEERMGALRFLFFYLAAGVVAGLAMVAMGPDSNVAVVGASGAIAGVLGAYLVLFPGGRITTILPLFIFVRLVEVPAILYLLLWFAIQLYSGIASGDAGPLIGGVAWWAHVGGFLFGVATGPILARAPAPRRYRRRV
jgi:membrane associated rhomboid family serine protease